jgi:hypothetical protein
VAESAYLLALFSGFFYLAAAFPLFRLSARSGESPERVLSITFLLIGISYLFYELPFALESEALFLPFSIAGRVFYDTSIVTLALFTKLVFHRDRSWANWLFGSTIALLVIGCAVSALYGDWEGLLPLSNPGFWAEWLGQSIPCAWVGLAGLSQHAKARRRLRVGLTDALVCNRFLLFGFFGILQLGSLAVLIPMYIGYETTGVFSTWSDRVLGSLEYLTIATIWIAFFPPALYRRWVRGAAMAETGGED